MVLSLQRVSLFLTLFLVVNPASLVHGDEVNSRWKDYGCRGIYNAMKDDSIKADSIKMPQFVPFTIKVDPSNKELHNVFDDIANWASQNADKLVGGASIAGVLFSSCLLYDTILLTLDIEGFFDKIAELRGQFNAFVLKRRPQLERLLAKTRLSVEAGNVPDEKDIRQIHYVLTLYLGDISDVLEKVADLIEEAREAEWDAEFTAVLSAVAANVAALAFALPAVPVPPGLAQYGLVATTGLSTVAGFWSLKNAHDCKRALREQRRELRQNLKMLRDQARSWVRGVMDH